MMIISGEMITSTIMISSATSLWCSHDGQPKPGPQPSSRFNEGKLWRHAFFTSNFGGQSMSIPHERMMYVPRSGPWILEQHQQHPSLAQCQFGKHQSSLGKNHLANGQIPFLYQAFSPQNYCLFVNIPTSDGPSPPKSSFFDGELPILLAQTSSVQCVNPRNLWCSLIFPYFRGFHTWRYRKMRVVYLGLHSKILWKLDDSPKSYPLVNVHSLLWKITIMAKSAIKSAIFSSIFTSNVR